MKVEGTREEVTARLWVRWRAGEDLVLANPRVLAGGRWSVELLARRPKPARRRRLVDAVRAARWEWVVVIGCSCTAVAAGLAYGVVYAVQAVWHWILAHLPELIGFSVMLGGAGVALLRLLLGGGGDRDGHCSGRDSGH